MTLNEVYQEWAPLKRRQVKVSTMATYLLTWNNHLKPKWGECPLKDITRHAVRPWAYELLDTGRSVKTVKDILICLKMLIHFASEELDEEAPSTNWRISWPTENKTGLTKIETYPNSVAEKVINEAINKPEPRKIALMIAFCTGMRIGELCGLQWKDVDLEEKVFKVRRTIQRIYMPNDSTKTEVFIGTTKTTSGKRNIPIVKNIIPILKKWKACYAEDYYVASCKENPSEPRVYRCWSKSFLEGIGVEKILKFHAIRHTFATSMIEAGVDVKSVSAIMGHSDVKTTMDLYVHPSDKTKSNAINKVFSKLF